MPRRLDDKRINALGKIGYIDYYRSPDRSDDDSSNDLLNSVPALINDVAQIKQHVFNKIPAYINTVLDIITKKIETKNHVAIDLARDGGVITGGTVSTKDGTKQIEIKRDSHGRLKEISIK